MFGLANLDVFLDNHEKIKNSKCCINQHLSENPTSVSILTLCFSGVISMLKVAETVRSHF